MGDQSKVTLDNLDLMLIAELEQNAHQTVADLGRKLDAQRHSIDRKLRRLLDNHIIRIVAIPDPLALVYRTRAFLGINCLPSEVNSVAQELKKYEEVFFITIATGRYDIHAWTLFEKPEGLSIFVRDELAHIHGVTSAETMVSLRIIKGYSGLLSGSQSPFREKPPLRKPDPLDRQLIRELRKNALQTYSKLAHALGSSPQTVWRRLQKLLEEHILRIIAIPNPAALGYTNRATIALDAKPDKIDAVAESLASFVNIHGVIINAGRFGIMAWGDFKGAEHLSDFVRNDLGQIKGLVRQETMLTLRIIKDNIFFENELY